MILFTLMKRGRLRGVFVYDALLNVLEALTEEKK